MDLPSFSLPLARAGFPSPADEWYEAPLDIGTLLAPRPASTFYARCDGTSMQKSGLGHGDVLVIDRALPAGHNSIVIVTFGGQGHAVKRLLRTDSGILLASDHPGQPAIPVAALSTWDIWGVVTYSIRPVDPSTALYLPLR